MATPIPHRRVANPARAIPRPVSQLRHASYSPAPQRPAAAPGPAAPGAGGPAGLDYSTDPILAQIRALAAQNVAAAEAAATTARTQALIRFGFDPNLKDAQGNSLYDASSQGAAAANPLSTLNQLNQQHQLRSTALDERLNNRNLFYSSTRGNELNQEYQNYLGQQAQAGEGLQTQLGNIAATLANAKSGAQGQIIGAEGDAYQRALDFGTKYGFPAGGGTAARPGPVTAGRIASPGAPLVRPRAAPLRTARPVPVPRPTPVYRRP